MSEIIEPNYETIIQKLIAKYSLANLNNLKNDKFALDFSTDFIHSFDKNLKINIVQTNDKTIFGQYNPAVETIKLYPSALFGKDSDLKFMQCLMTAAHECRHHWQNLNSGIKISPLWKFDFLSAHIKAGENLTFDALKDVFYTYEPSEIDARKYEISVGKHLFKELENLNENHKYDRFLDLNRKQLINLETGEIFKEIEKLVIDAKVSQTFETLMYENLKQLLRGRGNNILTMVYILGCLGLFDKEMENYLVDILMKCGQFAFASIINNSNDKTDEIIKQLIDRNNLKQYKIFAQYITISIAAAKKFIKQYLLQDNNIPQKKKNKMSKVLAEYIKLSDV